MPSTISDAVILSAVRTPVGKFQGSLASLSAPQLGARVVEEPVWAPDTPIEVGADGFVALAGLFDDEAASAPTRSQLADGPGFTSGAVAAREGLLPGFSAEGTVCSSRCASVIGGEAMARDPAAPCSIGAMNRSGMGPLAALAHPDTQPKNIAATMIEISRGDLVLN